MHAKRFAQDPARRALICGTVTADINVQDSSKTHVVVTVFIILTTINNGCWSLEWGFFFPVWLRYIWPISLQKNYGIRHDDLTHIYCKTFTTVSLVNTSWLYIFSLCCYYVRIFKVYSHGNFQVYKQHSTIKYSHQAAYRIPRTCSSYHWKSVPISPTCQPPATTNLLSNSLSLFF